MRIKHLLLSTGVTLALGVAGPGVEAPASAETIIDALVSAYQNNADLMAAREELRVTNEQRPQALGGWMPTVTLRGSADEATIDQRIAPSYDRRTLTGALEYNQTLYRGGALSATLDQAENTIRRQRALLTGTEQSVLLQAGSIFMDVIRDSRTLALNQNNIAVLEERRRATRALYDVGDATQADLSQAEARLAQARAQVIAAQGQLDASRATYAQIVGQPVEAPEMPGPVSGLPETLEAALSLAESWNPALRASDIAERIARDQIRIRQGEMLPSVALVGRIQEDSYDDPLPLDRQSLASLGVQLTVPLYQSGAEHARLREAKKRVNQRQLETVSELRKVEEQVIRAWRDLQTARASVAALDEQIAAARQAQDSVRREVGIGRRPLLDLLDAQQELLDAEVNRTSQQRNVVVGELTLLSSIGALTAESLGLPTDLHDPLADYEATKWRLFGTEIR